MNTKKKKLIAGIILISTIIIIMGLFDFLKPKSNNAQFVSETSFNSNRTKQMQMTPQTLDQLRKLNVTADKELKLEYFFFTNTDEKAEQLASEIAKLNYTVQHGVSAGDKKLFIVTGWTTKMKMADEVVEQWTKQMCELGYKFDCEFDGWGTEPDQE
jgi:regulator of RNase E activity RraB